MDNLREILPLRLKEAFGKDTQETIARKLLTQQGTVSKWINGTVVPPTDVLLLISKAYKVSVDWLLGVSDEKEIDGVALEKITYEQITRILDDLLERRIISVPDLSTINQNESPLAPPEEQDEDQEETTKLSLTPRYDSDYIFINDRAISFMLRRRLKFKEIGPDAYGFWKDNIANYAGIRLLDYRGKMQTAIDTKAWASFNKDGDWIDLLKELSGMSNEELTTYIQNFKEKDGEENG